MKHCSRCRERKAFSEFHRNRSTADGLNSYCKPCWLAMQKQSYDANPRRFYEVQRRSRLQRWYGITEEQHHALRIAQDDRCAICRVEADRLVVDHDHESGEVRGLLCDRCNLGVGYFLDSPEVMIAAAAYLTRERLPLAQPRQLTLIEGEAT